MNVFLRGRLLLSASDRLNVKSVLVKYRTDVFKYGPQLAALVSVLAKTGVRYFTNTDEISEVNK